MAERGPWLTFGFVVGGVLGAGAFGGHDLAMFAIGPAVVLALIAARLDENDRNGKDLT